MPMQPPKTHDHWLWGSLPAFRRDLTGFIREKRKLHGDIFRIDSSLFNAVVVTSPDAAQHVLQGNHRNYTKSRGYRVMAEFLGEGLLTSEGDYWLRQRRLAQPAFHRQKLAKVAETMIAECEQFAQRWEARIGERVDMTEEMSHLTMNIAAKTLFSADVGEQMGAISKSVLVLNSFAIDLIRKPLMRKFRWLFVNRFREFNEAANTIDGITYDIIRSRRKAQMEGEDLLGMLLAATDADTGETMSDKQVRDEVVTLFLAGHETSANALAWAWMLLAQHPQVAAKLRAELREVLGDRPLQLSDLGNLPYTRQVMQEVLRLYPPAYVIGRRTMADDVVAGFEIPAETNVLVSVIEIHRHPDFWQQPMAFQPERFAAGEPETHKYAYFPFGGGPRLCIGNQFALMEIQIALAVLARKFTPSIVPNAEISAEPLITLRPKGLHMALHERG